MFKQYKDERINELIKKSFEIAVKDDEWNIRNLQEWNILFEDIDKTLEYIENGYKVSFNTHQILLFNLNSPL